MSDDDIIELGEGDLLPVASQMTRAIQAGLPLESGLRLLAEQTGGRRQREALLALSERLERGVPLAEALHDVESGLPRKMRALVQAGLECGRLDEVMMYCIEQSTRAASLRRQICLMLSYPAFLAWFGSLVCGAVLLWVLPMFGRIFDDFGTELPTLTIFFLQLSDAMRSFGWIVWLALGVFGFWVVWFVLTLTNWGQRRLAMLPLVGPIFRYAALCDFCQILAVLVEARAPFPRAIQHAADASDDHWLHRRCRLMKSDIEQGVPPAKAARLVHLPNSLTQVFRHSSSQPILVDALRGLADIYESQSVMRVQQVNSILAPYSVAAVVAFVCLAELAVFMPLIKLLNDLS